MKTQNVVTGNFVAQLTLILNFAACSNPCLITGTSSRQHAQAIKASIPQLRIFTITSALPSAGQLQSIIFNPGEEPDVIIALGGGRIIDLAKLLLLRCCTVMRPQFIAIPTTAGSGSEATPFAVFYQDKEKVSVQDARLLPDTVLLDSELIQKLPSLQRAISAFDALTQSIESIWNLHATQESTQYAGMALQLLTESIKAFTHTQDHEVLRRVQWAAYLAGKAIAITKTTGCHALSYYLTAHHNVPHGQAVAYFLPVFIIYNNTKGSQPMKNILRELEAGSAEEGAAKVQALLQDCGLYSRFSQANLNIDLDALLNSVNMERFTNNPVPFNRERILELIKTFVC